MQSWTHQIISDCSVTHLSVPWNAQGWMGWSISGGGRLTIHIGWIRGKKKSWPITHHKNSVLCCRQKTFLFSVSAQLLLLLFPLPPHQLMVIAIPDSAPSLPYHLHSSSEGKELQGNDRETQQERQKHLASSPDPDIYCQSLAAISTGNTFSK